MSHFAPFLNHVSLPLLDHFFPPSCCFLKSAILTFWRRLVDAELSENGKVLSLPDGVFFEGFSKIFIRPCFEELFNVIIQYRERPSEFDLRVVLTGNPGLGKSMFGWFMLWKLVKAGFRVRSLRQPDFLFLSLSFFPSLPRFRGSSVKPNNVFFSSQ